MLTICAVALIWAVPAAHAGTANAGLRGAGSNPIANMKWGAPPNDDLGGAYLHGTKAQKATLGKIALQPRALWLGYWWKVNQVKAETALTVADTENGNPNVMTTFATFELHPWENKMTTTGVDKAALKANWNVSSDEAWYRNMAAGIGNARALVIVQVDLPVAYNISYSKKPEQIDTYAVKTLNANKHTTVYLDGGTAGWLKPAHEASILVANGIRYARGFALNDTDYDPTVNEDKFGAEVIQDLNKLGVKNKHFIVDTVENGQPYKPKELKGKGINDAPMCHGVIQTVCQRVGIPPTTNVASARWHLGAAAGADAKKYVDGYVWSGRPWDIDGGPFNLQNALWLAGNQEY